MGFFETGLAAAVIIGLSVVVAVALVAGLVLWARGRRDAARQKMVEVLRGETAIKQVRGNSWGIESLGVTQARGAGELALTPTRLIFVQWVPMRVLEIPRDRITGAERTNSHLGKYRPGKGVLKVRYTTESGAADSIAVDVLDLDTWVRDLAG